MNYEDRTSVEAGSLTGEAITTNLVKYAIFNYKSILALLRKIALMMQHENIVLKKTRKHKKHFSINSLSE